MDRQERWTTLSTELRALGRMARRAPWLRPGGQWNAARLLALRTRENPHELALAYLDRRYTWSELDANRPSALSDKFQHVIESGLTVYYGSPRQRRTARLMLYLHLISAYDESKLRFSQFPSIETALVERPPSLDNEKPWSQREIPSQPEPGGWDAG